MLFFDLTLNDTPIVASAPCVCLANMTLPQSEFTGNLMFVNQYGSLEVAPETLGTNYQLLYFDANNLSQVGVPLSPLPSQVVATVIEGQNCVVSVSEQVIATSAPYGATLTPGYDTGLDNGYSNQLFLAPYGTYVEAGYWDESYSV